MHDAVNDAIVTSGGWTLLSSTELIVTYWNQFVSDYADNGIDTIIIPPIISSINPNKI